MAIKKRFGPEKMKRTVECKLAKESAPACELPDDRDRVKKELERLDALDVKSAQDALNKFFTSPEWTRYGCRAIVQGQFIGGEIKTGILVVKDK